MLLAGVPAPRTENRPEGGHTRAVLPERVGNYQ